MNEMIELLASAIRESEAHWWNQPDEPDDGLAETLARAAIEAMPALGRSDTIQTLLDLINPLHGEIDRQLPAQFTDELEWDAPADREYNVNITAKMERDLTQAVMILEQRRREVMSYATTLEEVLSLRSEVARLRNALEKQQPTRMDRARERAKIQEPHGDQRVERCHWSKTGWAIVESDGRCTCNPAHPPGRVGGYVCSKGGKS